VTRDMDEGHACGTVLQVVVQWAKRSALATGFPLQLTYPLLRHLWSH
jgi:hypothetical protein